MTTACLKVLSGFKAVSPGFYSFMGPVAYYVLRDQRFTCQYYCDGMLSASLFSLVLGRRIRRTSFDYGSIARPFFEQCQARGLRLLAIGGTPAEAAAFGEHLDSAYPSMVQRCLHGYPAGGYTSERLKSIAHEARGQDVVLLALGSPLQERVGQYLVDSGFGGTVITAGAFVSQTVSAGSRPYYPALINTLNLRFLWRLLREPHTRSRFKYVFMFPFSYAMDRLRGRVQVCCR